MHRVPCASVQIAVAITLAACGRAPADPPPAPTEPPAAEVPPEPAPPAPTDGWRWEPAPPCIGHFEIPVPPGASLRSIPSDEGCIAGVGLPELNLVNVHRSTRTLAETRDGVARSWQVGSVHEETTATGWLYSVSVNGPSPLTYLHRDDLGITCIAMHTSVDIVRRVCDGVRPL